MLPGSRHALSTAALLLLARSNILTFAQLGGGLPNSTATSTALDPSTCPYRSINYITQTLPQQCLTSGWASKPRTQNVTKDDVAPMPTAVSMPGGYSISIQGASSMETAGLNLSNKSTQSVSEISTVLQSGIAPPLSTSAGVDVKHEVASKVEEDTETDSPLDNANFLSFDEWKRQNLAKAGQSAENIGNRISTGGSELRRRPGSINNALDSLGEDVEIDIDFRGFVNPGAMHAGMNAQDPSIQNEAKATVTGKTQEEAIEVTGAQRRGKDAGKTCKERSNYASFDCAATVLKTNPECKGSSAVLVENKDSYMLNTCSAQNKYFIVELCDDILIDTVVLANFEFFSSMFRTFKVSVSDRYPVKLDKWRDLGTFEARNNREIQAFLIETPLIWARYIRIEFLTHFGNEYYCPLSLFRIHGTTMMEEFNHDVKGSRSDDDSESEIEEEAASSSSSVSAETWEEHPSSVSAQTDEAAITTSLPTTSNVAPEAPSASKSSPDILSTMDSGSVPPGFSLNVLSGNRSLDGLRLLFLDNTTHLCYPKDHISDSRLTSKDTPSVESQHPDRSSRIETSTLSNSAVETPRVTATKPINDNAPTQKLTTAPDSASISHVVQSANDSSSKTVTQSSTNVGKVQSSPTQPPLGSPTTQESFFKSVHKRLQFLEANSTLSLQYIEEQSRILRDAFSKVEKRQLAKTSTFLETLNTTVLMELREFRMQYDQIWQSTVLELSSQREQSQHEVFALSARLSLLADQILFQQRMAIVQFLLILLCLGLVIFSRHGTNPELSLRVQNAINKSSANLSRYASTLESPPGSPSHSRPFTRNGLFGNWTHTRSPSEESDIKAGAKSPIIEYSPPTPESQRSKDSREGSPNREASGNSSDSFPEAGRGRQVESSPATLGAKREVGRAV